MRLGLVPTRSYQPELMDQDGISEEDLNSELRDIERVNRYLRGTTTLRRPVMRLVRRDGLRAFTLLDIGTGAGDVPRAVVASAGRRGIEAQAAGLDIDARTVRYAAGRGRTSRSNGRAPLSLLRGDGLRLPFADASFDFVTSSMMFHHFREPEAARLLAEMARVSRRAAIVNDLVRDWISWAVISGLTAIAAARITRNDAPLSVLRGWRPREMMELAATAGLAGRARVKRLFPYRVVLIVERKSA